MAVIIDGTTGVATPGVTDTGNLSVSGTTALTNPLPATSGGTGATSLASISVGNLSGGSAGTIPYQSTVGTTAMLATGTNGQVLTSAGALAAPTWSTPLGGFTAMQVFTANGTFTIPSGKTTVKVTVVGGGAGGEGDVATAAATSGLPSSVASGTQIISTISGNGGGSPATGSGSGATWVRGGLGGTSSGGDINFSGDGGGQGSPTAYGLAGFGGGSFFGGITPPSYQASGQNGLAYGAGGSGGTQVAGAGGGGGGGGTAIKYLTGLTAGNTLAVVIGNGGTGSTGSAALGGNGAKGVVIFEY